MRIKNKKKDGFSIIEVMVSFVIILVIVLLVGPNLFSMYEKSKNMSKVSDANAVVNAIDMHNLNVFVDGDDEDVITNGTAIGVFQKINESEEYLSNWPKWIEVDMIVEEIRDIASGKDGVLSEKE